MLRQGAKINRKVSLNLNNNGYKISIANIMAEIYHVTTLAQYPARPDMRRRHNSHMPVKKSLIIEVRLKDFLAKCMTTKESIHATANSGYKPLILRFMK